MACLYTNGFSKAGVCLENNLAGIKEFYVANYSGDTSWSADANNILTGVTTAPSTWYKVEQYREQGAYTQTHAQSDTGQNVWSIGAEMVFFKNDSSVRDLVKVMSQTETIVIALRNDGTYMLLGEQNGLMMKAGESGSGKAFEDFGGSRVNFETKQGYEAREISSTLFGTFTTA